MPVDLRLAEEALAQDGWTLLPSVVPADLLGRLVRELEGAYARQRALQVRNGVGEGTDGTVHHLPCEGGAFLELLEREHGQTLLAQFFGGPYILNTYGGVLNFPSDVVDVSYVGRVHRDLRSFSGSLHLMAQLLVMLDDFAEANGATYLMSGSHRMKEKPADEQFFKAAARATGMAGSIVVFDSNLWHAAGVNRTPEPRRALTLALTRPFIKQQLDYPRALGYERADAWPASLRQLLGYNARVPTSLDEWYQPAEKRMYKRDQG
ncbi:MAG: phytanoyl-CoA dioxygenase [Acidobacteria bacterium]|nr:MAG: phytanoyl-CoA dioxygenase [Acidobacteriota bacterium]